MDYQEITDKEGNKHIMVYNDDGSFKGFPADENNPEYVAFLAQLEQETE
jgi:hypothetical protein